MPMPARKCPTCAAAIGETVWVIPGKQCPVCYNQVEGQGATRRQPVTLNRSVWRFNDDLVLAPPSSDDLMSSKDMAHLSRDQAILIGKHGCDIQTAVSISSQFVAARGGPFEVVLRVTDNHKIPVTIEEFGVIAPAWRLSWEWLEKTCRGQALQTSWCKTRIYDGHPYLQILLRDVHDSVMTCFVLSSDLQTIQLRGFWFVQTPRTSELSKDTSAVIQNTVNHLIKGLEATTTFAEQPLLLPILYLETRLQFAEQGYMDGFLEQTYQNNLLLLEESLSVPTSNLRELYDHAKITAGIASSHRQISKMNLDVGKMETILRMITKGQLIAKANEAFYDADPQKVESLACRVDFLQERTIALESRIKLSTTQVQNLQTMIREHFQ
ncbi:hypothetical protein EJ08DRAFT_40157 [Tothia fuscella]|uniref:Uncharacterized protein n=1 Tax=Tothia fuscella TaxID=1048955 RepID=A0A9P4NXY8_9PEZI|nr:hypothetical protein EJ08DRAFT_40157 [Tothia fuscella]